MSISTFPEENWGTQTLYLKYSAMMKNSAHSPFPKGHWNGTQAAQKSHTSWIGKILIKRLKNITGIRKEWFFTKEILHKDFLFKQHRVFKKKTL